MQDLTVKIIFTTVPVKITKQTMKEKNIHKFRAGSEVSEQSPRFLAVQDSSIGDPVTHSLTHSLTN